MRTRPELGDPGPQRSVPGLWSPATRRARIRDALRSAGGVVGAGRLATHPPAPIGTPFGSAEPVEGGPVRAIAVAPAPAPAGMAFLDGIQRYALVGRVGLAPVVWGYVAAAVMTREGQALRARVERAEEFLVAPLERLASAQRRALEGPGLALHDCPGGERMHPMLELERAVQTVEHRRERLEMDVGEAYVEEAPGDRWLVVDGAMAAWGGLARSPRVIGVVKSHETQFLDGRDLEVALTLRSGERSTVFARTASGGSRVHTWYLRLRPWDEEDLTHGLVRVERAALPATVQQADLVSGWLLAERAPLSTPDGRWDRLLYPIHLVEDYLRARAGGLG